MAEGPSAFLANNLLDALGNADAYSAAGVFMKLHVGAPGAAGTANPATETVRKAVSFGPAAGGVMSNDAAIQWVGLPTADPEDFTHYTLWDDVDEGEGNFLQSGTITANAVSDGDTFTIPIGDLDLTMPIAS